MWQWIYCMVWGSMLATTLCPSIRAESPNVLIFLVDDLGVHDLSCEGSRFYETPNIDRIASQGMRFNNAYAACQVCSPSRAAIQTGKYPVRLQITDYIGAPQPNQWKRNTRLLPAPYQLQLGLDETTLAEAFGEMGYATFFAGKWHLGGEGFLPTRQGYSINRGGYAAGSPQSYFSPYKNPQLPDGPPGEQLPLRLARETADFVRAANGNGNKPFFAMLSFYSVHAPIQTTEALWRKYRDKAIDMGLGQVRDRFKMDRTQEVRQVQDNPLYAGMMESMDTAVGIVLEALEETGAIQNTIVVFTSDNGGVSSGDGFATSCLPLRGGKGRQWEGGIRVPLYISWPGVTHGATTSQIASHIDLFPTLLDMVGSPQSKFAHCDGISLKPMLRGAPTVDRQLYWHYPHYGNQGGEPSAIIRSQNWKLIHYFETGNYELYDLESDPSETTDLAQKFPDRLQSMRNELENWQSQVSALRPSPNPMYDANAHLAELERIRNELEPNREREHARLLSPDYAPAKGWWQDVAKRGTP